MRRDLWLTRLATAGIGVCALVVATTAAYPFISAALGWSRARNVYAVGDRIVLPSAAYADAPHTLIIFARSGCGVCQRLKPLLGTLVRRAAERASMAVKIVAPPTDRDAEIQFARDIGLDARDLLALDLGQVRVPTVPTIVVVSRDGSVKFVHVGAPGSSEDEATLVRGVAAFADR